VKPLPERPRASVLPVKAPAPEAPRTAAALQAKSDDVGMGSDLRGLRGSHAAGWVDVEDPYR
jgi:hypothetical protein